MKTQKFDVQKYGFVLLHAITAFSMVAQLFALGVLAYLGTFTRYLADDYCEMIIVRNRPLLAAVFENYMDGRIRAANRFSHLLLVGWSDMLGTHNVQIIPGLMILVWLIGLAWTIHEVRKLVGIQQSTMLDWFLAITLVFFSAWQAPNRFQTFFWRSSVTTHFAPLVFIFLLGGFMLYQIRSTKGGKPALWVSVVVFLSAFVIGGIAEPATAAVMVASSLLMIYVWRQRHESHSQPALILLLACGIGTFLALCAMFFAPGNLLHGTMSLAVLPQVIAESFLFSFQFVWDTLLISPLPTLISVLLPGALFFCLYVQADAQPLSIQQERRVKLAFILIPLIHFLLIAASFAPSAYGQAYPVERARFIGRFLMTAALMFDGALLGVWLAQAKKISMVGHAIFPLAALIAGIMALYPLRAGLSMWSEVNEYKTWASAWDTREAGILAGRASGEMELKVQWLPNRYRVKDIDGSVKHWMNNCVAIYYGVNTIRSVPAGQ